MAQPYIPDDEQGEQSVPYMTITNEDDRILSRGENYPRGKAESNDLCSSEDARDMFFGDGTFISDEYVQSLRCCDGEQDTVNKAALHSLLRSFEHVKKLCNKEQGRCALLEQHLRRKDKEIQRLTQTHEGTQISDRCRSLSFEPNTQFVAPNDVSIGTHIASNSIGALVTSNSPKTPHTLKSVASQTDSSTATGIPSVISDPKPVNLVLPNTSVLVGPALTDELQNTQAFSLLTGHIPGPLVFGDTLVIKSRASEDSFSIIESASSTELPANITLPHPTNQRPPPCDAQHSNHESDKLATAEREELPAGADVSAESLTMLLAKDLQWMKQQFAVAHKKVVAINNEMKRDEALILSMLASPKFNQLPAAKLSMPVQQFGPSSIHHEPPRNKMRSRFTSLALHRSAPPQSFPKGIAAAAPVHRSFTLPETEPRGANESLSRSTPVSRSTYEMQDDLLRQFNTAESNAESFVTPTARVPVPIDHGAGGDGAAVPLPTGSQDRLINALDIPMSTNQLKHIGGWGAPPAVGAIQHHRPLPNNPAPPARVLSSEHICPVCLGNFGHFAMPDFQEHVFECADSDKGLDSNRAVPTSRKCPVCFAIFPDLKQTDFEKHCDDHFMQN